MECTCNCIVQNIAIEPESRPRYHVSASRNVYISESYDTLEEALARTNALAAEGYPQVIIRDNEAEGDIW